MQEYVLYILYSGSSFRMVDWLKKLGKNTEKVFELVKMCAP